MAWSLVFKNSNLHNSITDSCEFDEISSEISLSIDSSIANRPIRCRRQNFIHTRYVEHVLRPSWPQFMFQFSFASNKSSEMQNKTVFFNLYCSVQVPLSRIFISIGIIFSFILKFNSVHFLLESYQIRDVAPISALIPSTANNPSGSDL